MSAREGHSNRVFRTRPVDHSLISSDRPLIAPFGFLHCAEGSKEPFGELLLCWVRTLPRTCAMASAIAPMISLSNF